MTPVETIIKNIIAIGLLIWLIKLLPADGKSNFWLLKSVGLGLYFRAVYGSSNSPC